MAQNILANPAATTLWDLFISHCDKLTAFRQSEDVLGFDNRKAELDFLQSLKTVEGIAAYERATAEDKRLTALMEERGSTDGDLVKALFESAIKLGVELKKTQGMSDSATASLGAVTFAQAFDATAFHPSCLSLSSPSPSLGLRGLGNAGTSFTPSLSRVGSPAQSKKSDPNKPPRPNELCMADLTKQDILVEFPKKSSKYYILVCPLCDRTFQSAHGMYGHISQSDQVHLALFGGSKSFKQAVKIGGIPVIDADAESVEAHNAPAINKLMAPVGKGGI